MLDDASSLLALYMVVGIAAYGAFEAWDAVDTMYFLTTSSATVGYGDYVPKTDAGKLFSCAFLPVGTVLLYRSMVPFAVELQKSVSAVLIGSVGRVGVADDVDVDGVILTRQLKHAVVVPLLLLGAGALLFHLPLAGMECSFVDALYFSFSSLSTIGFGDLRPVSLRSKMVVLSYVALSAAATAHMLVQLYQHAQRRAMRSLDHRRFVAELLLQDSCWDSSFDGSHQHARRADGVGPSESEFMLSVLTAHEVVDVPTLVALRRQYALIVCQGKGLGRRAGGREGCGIGGPCGSGGGATDGSSGAEHSVPAAASAGERRLDARLVFDVYVNEGKVCQRYGDAPEGTVLAGAETDLRTEFSDSLIATVDLRAADGGYAEWHANFWLKRVKDARTRAGFAHGGRTADAASHQADGIPGRHAATVGAGAPTRDGEPSTSSSITALV